MKGRKSNFLNQLDDGQYRAHVIKQTYIDDHPNVESIKQPRAEGRVSYLYQNDTFSK